MKQRDCKNCIWADQCASEEPCEHYCDAEDNLDEQQQHDREEFRRQWQQYVRRDETDEKEAADCSR